MLTKATRLLAPTKSAKWAKQFLATQKQACQFATTKMLLDDGKKKKKEKEQENDNEDTDDGDSVDVLYKKYDLLKDIDTRPGKTFKMLTRP